MIILLENFIKTVNGGLEQEKFFRIMKTVAQNPELNYDKLFKIFRQTIPMDCDQSHNHPKQIKAPP